MIIDSHCHLDYPSLYNELDNVVRRAKYNQVKYLLTICTTLESFEKIKLIIKKYKNIYGTFGIHPHESKKYMNVDSEFIYNGIKKGGSQYDPWNNQYKGFVYSIKTYNSSKIIKIYFRKEHAEKWLERNL